MLTNNQVKFLRSLQLKKNRNGEKLFIAEGEKIVEEILNSQHKVNSVFAVSDWVSQHKNKAYFQKIKSEKISLTEVSENELSRISSLTTPNKVIAIVQIPENTVDTSQLKDQWSIVLDEIQDPGNLGTLIRTADWFGIRTIICSENSVDLYNAKVIQSTMGSFCRVHVAYTNLEKFFQEVKEKLSLPVFGAVLNGKDISGIKIPETGLLLLGNESRGISENLYPFITQKVSIPSVSGIATAESLNVAIANGILCYELFKSRMTK